MRNRLILVAIVLCAVFGIPGAYVLVRSGLPDIPYYHLASAGALVTYAIIAVGMSMAFAVFLVGYAVFSIVRGHDQQPIPHSPRVSSKIGEVEREPQKLQGAKRRPIKSLPASKSQRRKFAIGVRNGFPSIAKIASANLQDDMDANSLDDLDRKIIEAYANLRSQNRKPTGIAIANMTGVAQRTVYDRAEKIRGRGIVL